MIRNAIFLFLANYYLNIKSTLNSNSMQTISAESKLNFSTMFLLEKFLWKFKIRGENDIFFPLSFAVRRIGNFPTNICKNAAMNVLFENDIAIIEPNYPSIRCEFMYCNGISIDDTENWFEDKYQNEKTNSDIHDFCIGLASLARLTRLHKPNERNSIKANEIFALFIYYITERYEENENEIFAIQNQIKNRARTNLSNIQQYLSYNSYLRKVSLSLSLSDDKREIIQQKGWEVLAVEFIDCYIEYIENVSEMDITSQNIGGGNPSV